MLVNEFPDRTININSQDYLYFGGTAYLGLPSNKKFKKLLYKNISIWGSAYGSSRNANIQLSAYEKGEAFLANYIRAEAALTVSSGMLAGKIAIEALQSQTDCFFHFPNTHNAIKDKLSIPLFEGKKLNPRLLTKKKEKITVTTDAVPSECVTAVDLSILKMIPENKEITLLIDESHSLGILGKNGGGIYSYIDLPNIKRKIMVASLGKAMGLSGGVIAGDNTFIEKIKNTNTFASGAGMNPAFVNTLAAAKKIYHRKNTKLKENLNYIASKLNPNDNFLFNNNYPAIYPKIAELNDFLFSKNIIITHFKYPNEGGILNRIVITANHKKKDLDKIIEILNHY